MKCNNCNFDNRDGVNFCERCGEPLGRDVNFNQHNKSDNENPNYDGGINLLLIIKILVGLYPSKNRWILKKDPLC